ncbi:unnamed protein product [Ambrosiozyma monospora]|uniref:Unnamed protein product n=1 Tax=Ambrosiozyma monospora TaxID=43982 RepID=A0ACB5TBA8_AMBMO|nr:unnamed protein product [Ambrosiozyma monospora]
MRNGELFCEWVPINPENVSVNEIQEESVPKTMDMEANTQSNSIDSEVATGIQDITDSQAEKQPLLPDDINSQSNEAQTNKSSIVSIAISALTAVVNTITSLFTRSQDDQNTHSTVYNDTAEYGAGSLLDCLDWLDSMCVQFAPLSRHYAIVRKQQLKLHDAHITKSYKVQTNKTYGVVIASDDASTSTNVGSEAKEVHLSSSSTMTFDLVNSGIPAHRARSLFDELDWLDSVCIQSTPFAYA